MSWVLVGKLLGAFYFGWAVFALAGCFGPHLFIALFYAVPGGRAAPVVHVLELVYGLLHPILYLLVIQPRLADEWSPWWLMTLQWLTLAAYWGLRCWGHPELLRDPWRIRLRQFLAWCFVFIAALMVRDVLLVRLQDEQFFGSYAPFFVACLYALPLFALSGQWRALSWERSDKELGFGIFRFSPKVVIAAGVVGVLLLVPGMHASRSETRTLLERNRELIHRAAQTRKLDPRLLAAIISVTQRQTLSRVQLQLENAVTELWLSDPRNHSLIGESLDPSLGMSQIKSDTLMEANAITYESAKEDLWFGNDYRSVVSRHRAELIRVRSAALEQVRRPGFESPLPDKQRVVLSLRSEPGNVEALGFLLDCYATQWESSNEAWSIRQKPEVLATLFQLGFAHSHPHGDPQPNDFGRMVLAEMQDPWIVERFASPSRP